MVAVELTNLWLTPVADPADALVLPLTPGGGGTWPNRVETREYSGGFYRAIRRPGISQTWTPQLKRLTLTQRDALLARAGALHWARDPWGGRVACTWAAPAWTALGVQYDTRVAMFTVSVSLTESTYSEV